MILILKYCLVGIAVMAGLEFMGSKYAPQTRFNTFDRVLGVFIFPLILVAFIFAFIREIIKHIIKNDEGT